ncbi:MAG: peptidylprolyl isomerase [Candidatus Omnitrophota bacterium]
MKTMKKILTTAFICFAAAVQAMPAFAEVLDKIEVVVNSELITRREIDRILEPIYEQYRTVYYGDDLIQKLDEARQKVLNQLIEDRLILSEAKRLNVTVDEKEVDERLDEAKKQFDSNEAFERALLEQGIAAKDLRKRYREQLMMRRLIDQKVGSKVNVTPGEISDYYKAHINEYEQGEDLKVRNILIRPEEGPDGAGKALSLANEILKRIKDGGDFDALAKGYSQGPYAEEGGLMGYVKKGDLLPEIESVVFSMKEGEVSGVIETSLGYHIFKVEEKRKGRIRELSEVKREIEQAIFREKIKGKIEGWVEDLKKNAYIDFK